LLKFTIYIRFVSFVNIEKVTKPAFYEPG